MLHYGAKDNAWYIECQDCVKNWAENKDERKKVFKERERIGERYEAFLEGQMESGVESEMPSLASIETSRTVSEVGTPREVEIEMPVSKTKKVSQLDDVKMPAPKKMKVETPPYGKMKFGVEALKDVEVIDLT